jgi:peptidoglycan/LPS O-acetylase OafA/YrhL
MSASLAERARGRDNNFNLLRLLAAGLVLLSHSWPLTATPGEPLERFADFSLGHLGVDIFFVVSGFLVTGSLLARGSLAAFARARTLRIFPALAASAFGTALVIGPLVSELPVWRYLTTWDTWRYALQNSTTWPWGVRWWLPGVFLHQPGGPAVNGALWSLPWELSMYVVLAMLGAALLRPRPLLSRAGVRNVVVALALLATLGHGLNEGFDWSRAFRVVQGLRLVALFFTAGALQFFKPRVPLSGAGFVAALVTLPVVLWAKGFALVLYPIALSYVVLWLALVPGGVLRRYNRLGDYSYGFYLWQFPLQQCIVLARPGITQPELLLASLPAALAVAVVSWHALEAPALAFKERGTGAVATPIPPGR